MRVSDGGKPLLTSLLLLLLLLSLGETCGPGRGSGRRRRPKKLTPLVFKQHVPNVSENSLGASGLADGPIKRGDAKFKDLVRNNNPDIIFKDEEGTGADRIMSQRCKDKLNTLAISVVNQWPGVKLRVTEAWDEDGLHAENSLHYEGRAVDITTSDRDRSKYGMLARLAVEAGFDWVYYETRGQIHCSVKSDSSIAINFGGCFPPASKVITSSGQTKSMSELQIGDSVLSITQDGRLEFSDVIAFLDINQDKVVNYYTLTTQFGYSITLTGKHLIYTTNITQKSKMTSVVPSNHTAQPRLTFAEDVSIGEYIFSAKDIKLPFTENIQGLSISVTRNSSNFSSSMDSELQTDEVSHLKTLIPQKVVSIKIHSIRGVYAPLTLTGTIVVDNFAASCYAFIQDERLAHAVFTPLRGYYVITTFLSDWLGRFVRYFDWMNTISCFYDTKRNETILRHDKYGTHWYARLLYTIAVNIIGMDIQILI